MFVTVITPLSFANAAELTVNNTRKCTTTFTSLLNLFYIFTLWSNADNVLIPPSVNITD